MKSIIGLNTTRGYLYLFIIVFLFSISCSSKTLDLRMHGGKVIEEEGPVDDDDDDDDPYTPKNTRKKIYTKLVAGKYHNCAITKNKHVACWGSSFYGQSGGDDFVYDTPAIMVKTDKSHVLSNVKDIVAGDFHTCALLNNKTVKCWGANVNHQLGNGNTTDPQYYAVDVLTDEDTKLKNVEKIASKQNFSCAIWKDENDSNIEKVRCWGVNGNGQLGNGNTTTQMYAVEVQSLSHVKDIVVSYDHSCAIWEDSENDNTRKVKCWGTGNNYKLGNGSTGNKSSAVDVNDLKNVTEIALGKDHNCAIWKDTENNNTKKVKCWGKNGDNQLGNGNKDAKTSVEKVQIKVDDKLVDFEGITKLSVGDNHSCAIWEKDGDNGVKCWGEKVGGQLGKGDEADQLYAVDVITKNEQKPLKDISDIITKYNFSCSIGKNNKKIRCWGVNYYEQLGAGKASGLLKYATNVLDLDEKTGLLNAKSIAFSNVNEYADSLYHLHACVLLEDGDVRCSGRNNAFELGYGVSVYSAYGVEVPSFSDHHVTKIVHYGSSYCALFKEGKVKCWGKNDNGQLGVGNKKDVLEGQEAGYVKISESVDLDKIKDIAAGNEYFCVIAGDDSSLMCWGENSNGKLGNDTNTIQEYAVNVLGDGGTNIVGVSALALTTDHGCAIIGNNKALKCWGKNNDGKLGDGSTTDRSHAVDVLDVDNESKPLVDVREVFLDTDYSCAIVGNNRTLKCWGKNVSERLGRSDGNDKKQAGNVKDNSTSESLAGVKEFIMGGSSYNYNCVIVGDNRNLKCWGDNTSGKLGINDSNNKNQAYDVKFKKGEEYYNLSKVKKVVLGKSFACAITGDSNDLMCWGKNEDGQLGNNTNTESEYAIDVQLQKEIGGSLSQVSDVQIVSDTACAVSSGVVKCWGKGYNGFYDSKDASTKINFAQNIKNKDGTSLSDVKSIKLYESGVTNGNISNEYFGYAILKDNKQNIVKYWGVDKGRGVLRPFGEYLVSLDVKYKNAYSVLSRDYLEPIKHVSEISGSYDVQWLKTEDDKVWFLGLTSYSNVGISYDSSIVKPIDSSFVETDND